MTPSLDLGVGASGPKGTGYGGWWPQSLGSGGGCAALPGFLNFVFDINKILILCHVLYTRQLHVLQLLIFRIMKGRKNTDKIYEEPTVHLFSRVCIRMLIVGRAPCALQKHRSSSEHIVARLDMRFYSPCVGECCDEELTHHPLLRVDSRLETSGCLIRSIY